MPHSSLGICSSVDLSLKAVLIELSKFLLNEPASYVHTNTFLPKINYSSIATLKTS